MPQLFFKIFLSSLEFDFSFFTQKQPRRNSFLICQKKKGKMRIEEMLPILRHSSPKCNFLSFYKWIRFIRLLKNLFPHIPPSSVPSIDKPLFVSFSFIFSTRKLFLPSSSISFVRFPFCLLAFAAAELLLLAWRRFRIISIDEFVVGGGGGTIVMCGMCRIRTCFVI